MENCPGGFWLEKSTTFTVLKRLCEKGTFINEGGTVRSLLSREEYVSSQSQRFVEETFSGSLPAFLAAFTAGKGLSAQEAAYLQQLLDQYQEV